MYEKPLGMSDNTTQILIDGLLAKIEELEKPTLPLKHAVNALCASSGLDPHFTELGSAVGNPANGLSLKSDQFFNRPLASCVGEYMELRKQRGLDGPSTVEEIFSALNKGGYRFETTGEDNTKRAIKISLSKNTAQFVKIGEDTFGLKKWYGMRAPRKSGTSDQSKTGTETDAEEEVSAEAGIEPEPTTLAPTKVEDF